MRHDPREVLAFWFDPAHQPFWFAKDDAFDRLFASRFAEAFAAAKRGDLKDWEQAAETRLALIILLDQYPRNAFRDSRQAFATDTLARAAVQGGLRQGHDQQLPLTQRAFFYLPLMHSESLSDQDASVELYEKAGLTENLAFALEHRDIIARFGRFPHRNAVLGRESSEDEQDFLRSFRGF